MKNKLIRIVSCVLVILLVVALITLKVIKPEVESAEIQVYDISFTNDTYNIATTGIDFGKIGDQRKRAQTFAATEGGNIQSVDVKIIAIDSPGDLVAELYACNPLGRISGEAIAAETVSQNLISESEFTEISIPFKYDGLENEKIYAIMLSQKNNTGAYGWYCSYDVNHPEGWWNENVHNPQIKQKGYNYDLSSFKITDRGEIVDDSQCGDLWLKVNYFPKDNREIIFPEESLKAIYQDDMKNGGLSFYMDRVLARQGVDPSLKEDSGIMTRGKALYTKGSNEDGLVKEFGFGGTMRYIKGDHAGYTIRINNQTAADFSENIEKRIDYPSHWTSSYSGKSGTQNDGIEVETYRFITENNIAVTMLSLKNVSTTDKTVNLTLLAHYCSDEQENYLTGNIWVDYRNISLKASMDGAEVKNGNLEKTLTIPANETISIKAQLGYLDMSDDLTVNEYNTYSNYSAEEALYTHVQTYNNWWVDNIPYMWVSDTAMQKMIAYRWWIVRVNTVDASTVNYPFPTAMEGVFGYNNAIVNAIPWQMDELRYLRSPMLEYGTWADAVISADGGIFRDNPAGVWGVKPQQYISKAGWESYKVHGGQVEFLKAMAEAGARDVEGTRAQFDANGDFLYDIQYDAWDYDTASLAISGKQERIDTASLTWNNAMAVSEMYNAIGNTKEAAKYRKLADDIRDKNVANSWDAESKQFLMKMSSTGEFNHFRDINNYYGFMVGMIPRNSGYDSALSVWRNNNEFPAWPMYVSNSADYNIIQNDSRYENRSRNYSPGNVAITLKLFASVIKNYESDSISGKDFGDLLKKYTEICYVDKNFDFPDTNEFFNGNPDKPYRSWIHHNFHSQYNTLIIENIMGITPREDKIIELDPIDTGLDSFKISQLKYHGSDISVILDEEGYRLLVNEEQVAVVDRLCHFTWNSQTGEVSVLDDSGAIIKESGAISDFKTAYEISYTDGKVSKIMESLSTYKPGDKVVEREEISGHELPNHSTSYKIKTSDGSNWADNFNLDFGDYSGDQWKRAQMFVATESGTMTGVQVMIRNKSAKKDVTVELYSADSLGQPNKALAKTIIPMNKISFADMGVVTAHFNYTLEAGKTYYIVLGQETGGVGIYCWALSAKDMAAGTQGYQEGYNGNLNMYKIERNDKMVEENNLGDYFLEVFVE